MTTFSDTTFRTLYPAIEPYETGFLDVGHGHRIYYERTGTPGAKPAVFLHGGPGGGISPEYRRYFNPARYDVLLFDQRGCGRSTPHAEIIHNTTWDLVEDIERLRKHTGVSKWLVFGGSWGSSLALAYSETHPQQVSEIILRGVYTVTQAELNWYYQFGVSQMFPEEWEAFLAPVPVQERHNMIAAYHKLLTGDDVQVQLSAAKAWTLWEGKTTTLLPDAEHLDEFTGDHFAIAFARLENHYFYHQCWLEEGQLLRDIHRLQGIPGIIVHGRYDMPCPATFAWHLHKAWPGSVLHLIEGAGHAMSEPGIRDQLLRATDYFAGQEP